jgi:hypothetical protein
MRRTTNADAWLRSTRSNAGDFLTNLTGCVYSAVLQAQQRRGLFPAFHSPGKSCHRDDAGILPRLCRNQGSGFPPGSSPQVAKETYSFSLLSLFASAISHIRISQRKNILAAYQADVGPGEARAGCFYDQQRGITNPGIGRNRRIASHLCGRIR